MPVWDAAPPRILIISSKEALPVSTLVMDKLTGTGFDVDGWWQVFPPNSGYLETLVDSCGYYDAVVAVFGADDRATIRGREVAVPRDNVVFEFGMFLGRLGAKRAFFLLEHGVELFSDWEGVSHASFERGAALDADVETATAQIRTVFAGGSSSTQEAHLPEVVLARSYAEERVTRLFDAFHDGSTLTEIPARGSPASAEEGERAIDPHLRHPTLTVLVPHSLKDLQGISYSREVSRYGRVTVTDRRGTETVLCRRGPEGTLQLLDIPLSLRGVESSIKASFSRGFLDQDGRRAHVEARALARWARTLSDLWPTRASGPNIVIAPWEDKK
jgi:hypothetical protein